MKKWRHKVFKKKIVFVKMLPEKDNTWSVIIPVLPFLLLLEKTPPVWIHVETLVLSQIFGLKRHNKLYKKIIWALLWRSVILKTFLLKKELARIIRNKAKYSNFAIQKMYWGQLITNNKQSHNCTHCNYIICII